MEKRDRDNRSATSVIPRTIPQGSSQATGASVETDLPEQPRYKEGILDQFELICGERDISNNIQRTLLAISLNRPENLQTPAKMIKSVLDHASQIKARGATHVEEGRILTMEKLEDIFDPALGEKDVATKWKNALGTLKGETPEADQDALVPYLSHSLDNFKQFIINRGVVGSPLSDTITYPFSELLISCFHAYGRGASDALTLLRDMATKIQTEYPDSVLARQIKDINEHIKSLVSSIEELDSREGSGADYKLPIYILAMHKLYKDLQITDRDKEAALNGDKTLEELHEQLMTTLEKNEVVQLAVAYQRRFKLEFINSNSANPTRPTVEMDRGSVASSLDPQRMGSDSARPQLTRGELQSRLHNQMAFSKILRQAQMTVSNAGAARVATEPFLPRHPGKN